MPLVYETMFSKGKTIVSHVEDNGILHEAVGVQVFKHSLYTFVNAKKGFAIQIIELVEWDGTMIHVVYPMPAVPLLFYPVWYVLVVILSCIYLDSLDSLRVHCRC